MTHHIDRSDPMFALMENIVRGDGAWITWYHDTDNGMRRITGIHATELDALRIANATETRAIQIPYGVDPQAFEGMEP